MSKRYAFLPLILGIASCASRISYVGTAYSPTKKVDIFVDESAIKRTYSIVGKGYLRGNLALTSPEKVQSNAIVKAKEKGADAILLKDYYLPVGYNGISTRQTDSAGKGSLTVGSSAVAYPGSEFIVLFLKYQ
jgi:hypothetical protein